MDELAEVYEVLNSYKTAIDALIQHVDVLNERIDGLERTLFDDILTPAKEAFDADAKEQRYGAFHERHGAKLDPYNEQLRAIEGDDFDLARTAMDGYEELEDGEGKPTEDEYVETLIAKVQEQLAAIRDKLGAGEVKAEAKADGTTEVDADGKKVDDAQMDLGLDGGNEATDNPEEIAALEKELEQYK